MSSSQKFFLVTAVLACFIQAFAQTNVPFQLSAKNLPAMDPFGGAPDPYVVITYENPPNPPLRLGETSKLSDTHNPVWPDLFSVVHLNGTSQTLTLDVWDDDLDSDDFIGAATIRLDDILSSFGGTLERNITINNSTVTGQIIVTANLTRTA